MFAVQSCYFVLPWGYYHHEENQKRRYLPGWYESSNRFRARRGQACSDHTEQQRQQVFPHYYSCLPDFACSYKGKSTDTLSASGWHRIEVSIHGHAGADFYNRQDKANKVHHQDSKTWYVSDRDADPPQLRYEKQTKKEDEIWKKLPARRWSKPLDAW